MDEGLFSPSLARRNPANRSVAPAARTEIYSMDERWLPNSLKDATIREIWIQGVMGPQPAS